MAVVALFLLGAWWVLPSLLPDTALTEQPRSFVLPTQLPTAPTSHLSLPIELPLAELERRLTREVDSSLARSTKDDFEAHRSGRLRLRADPRGLTITLPLSFRSRSGPNTKGSLVVRTRVLADIAPNWQPRVSVSSSFDWTRKPKVKVLFFDMRVSGVVGRAIAGKLADLDADLAKRIRTALQLRPRAEKWWLGLHEPDLLSDSPPVWLSVKPRSFYVQPLGGDARTLRLGVGIRADLATSIAALPESNPAQALPPLARATDSDRGFALHLPTIADYGGLTARLRENLVGRKIQLERGSITPTDFELYTSGRDLVVGVAFRGDAPGILLDTRGTVYFTGEPRFDPATKILTIENFGFTRRLSNPLLTGASWVLQDSLRREIQHSLRWELGSKLQEGAQELTARLNQPFGDHLTLAGSVHHLNLTGIECAAEGIRLGLEVRGTLKVTLREQA